MNKKLRCAFWILCVLLVAVVAYMVVVANNGLTGTASLYQGQIVLSSNDCKQLSTDLESGNPTRLAIWKLYFARAAEGKIVSGEPDVQFQDVVGVYNDQYTSHEKPARSNYFGVLLAALGQKQHFDGITVNELIGYLGQPDETSNSFSGKVMLYKFSASGQNAIGLVEIEKDTVSAITIKPLAR